MSEDYIIGKYMKKQYGDENIARIMRLNEYLRSTTFYEMPASTRYHGNYTGGLNEHSASVFSQLCLLTEANNLLWMRPESPYIIAYGHDTCKIDMYKEKDSGWTVADFHNFKCRFCGYVQEGKAEHCPQCDAHMGTWESNPNQPEGHGDLSVERLKEAGIELTTEEELCIRWHMGAFDDPQNWSCYTKAVSEYPNVLWTHTADMLASQVMGV